jgi:hypothetical protein
VRRIGPAVFAGWINIALIGFILVFSLVVAGGRIGFDDSRQVSEQTGDLLSFASLCGLSAFATIEILKRIFGLRGAFQERQTRNWLEQRYMTDGFAFHQLLHAIGVAQPDDVRRVFNLATERLAAQISDAADRALAEPDDYGALLEALTGKSADHGAPDDKPGGTEADQRRAEFLRSQRVRTGIDQLQISLGERWRLYVQGAALWISGAYGIALIHASKVDDGAEARYVLAALLLGGMIAWIARDVVALVERARR